jgi:hypothetical protein
MQCVNHLIDGVQAVFFCSIGEMGIACSCCGAGMTEQDLDMTQA